MVYLFTLNWINQELENKAYRDLERAKQDARERLNEQAYEYLSVRYDEYTILVEEQHSGEDFFFYAIGLVEDHRILLGNIALYPVELVE